MLFSDGRLIDESTYRRQILRGLAAGGMGMLAGCETGSGDRDTSPGGQTTEQLPEETGKTLLTSTFTDTQTANFNPYDPIRHGTHAPWVFFGMGQLGVGTVNIETEEFIPNLLTEQPTVDGKTVTLSLNDKFTWHNGKPLNAEDFRAKFRLDKLNQAEKWEYIDSVKVVDKTTFEITTKKQMNQVIATNKILFTPLNVFNGGYWEGFLDRYDEDIPTYKKAQIRGDLRQLTLRDGKGESKHAIGWGPFEMSEINPQHALLTRFDDHPYADELNFEAIRFKTFLTKQAKFRALLNSEIDAAHSVPTNTVEKQLTDNYESYEYPRNVGVGWAFQYDRPEINNIFQDRRVRRAFAHVLNKEKIVRVAGLSENLTQPVPYDSGYFGDESLHKEYMGNQILNKLSPAEYSPNHQKAAELLRKAGWTKQNGSWNDHTGETVSITIKVPTTWVDWVNMAQASASQLSDFGIETEFKAEELVVYYGITMPQGKFDMAGWYTGGAQENPHPGYEWLQNGIPAVVQDHSMPEEYEIPMPVGNPNGSTGTVNPNKILREIAVTDADIGETEPTQDLFAKLAWWYNQAVPVYMINRNMGYGYVNTSEWAAPSPDSELAKTFYPLWTFLNFGKLKARG